MRRLSRQGRAFGILAASTVLAVWPLLGLPVQPAWAASPATTAPGASSAPASTPTVVAWGDDERQQAEVPAGLSGVMAVSAGNQFGLALKTDGTVAAWGYEGWHSTAVPAGLSHVTAISTGMGRDGMALKSDGTVVVWGDAVEPGTNQPPSALSGVVSISAGDGFFLALKSDGTVVGWGESNRGHSPTNIPENLSGVTAIAAGHSHSLALKSDGTVVGWGDDTFGETDTPAGLCNVVAIAAGLEVSLALEKDGTVVAWGNKDYGATKVPSGLTGVTGIVAGVSGGLALKADGTLVGWGDPDSPEMKIPAGLSQVTNVSCGIGFCLAVGVGPAFVPAGMSAATLVYTAGTLTAVVALVAATVVIWYRRRRSAGQVEDLARLQPTGALIRLVALVLDAVILYALLLIVVVPAALNRVWQDPEGNIFPGFELLVAVLSLGYWPFCWWAFKGSPGQLLLGLRVVRLTDGRAIGPMDAVLRVGLLLVSGFTIVPGVVFAVMAFRDPSRRSMLDHVSGSVVLRKVRRV